MVLIGLLLILVAVAAGVWLVLGTQSLTTPIDLDTPGFHVSATPLALLIAGAAVLFVLWLGLAAIRGSVKRRRRPAREAKEAQRQAEFEENIRADERARAEETHQGALAERDRVREEEFSAKLAERDRIRDADERTRLAEHEQRVRAEERAKVEEEHSRRAAEAARSAAADAAAVGGGAAGAGAAGAVGGGAAGGVGDEGASTTEEGEDRVTGVAGRHELQHDRGVDADEELHDQHGGPDTAVTRAGGRADTESSVDSGADALTDSDERDADTVTDPGVGSDEHDADGGNDADGEHHAEGERYRTVADKIMGRGPTGHD